MRSKKVFDPLVGRRAGQSLRTRCCSCMWSSSPEARAISSGLAVRTGRQARGPQLEVDVPKKLLAIGGESFGRAGGWNPSERTGSIMESDGDGR